MALAPSDITLLVGWKSAGDATKDASADSERERLSAFALKFHLPRRCQT